MARSMGGVVLHKATDITSLLVTGTWLSALFLGYDWWLPALLFGYIVVLPLVDLLTDGYLSSDDADDEPAMTDEQTTQSTTTESNDQRASTSQDALDTLRDRYARGELTDEQFERKLERLLETESMEDVEDRARETERA